MSCLRKVLRRFCFIIAGLPGVVAAEAQVVKVNSPETFEKALEKATPGSTIIIANGTYTNWYVEVNISGTAQKPIIIRGESQNKVVCTGEVRKPAFLIKGDYVELSNISFQRGSIYRQGKEYGVLAELLNTKHSRIHHVACQNDTAKTQFMPLIIVGGNGEGNRVDHCSFRQNIDNQEIQVRISKDEVPQRTLIDHNEFTDKPKVTWANFNGGECVQVGQDPVLLGNQQAFTTVRDNHFVRCDAEPEVISNKSSANRYLNNLFEDCTGELVMRGGHDCIIDSNKFIGGNGIRINGTGHTIAYNSFKKVANPIRLMYGMANGKNTTGFYIAASNCKIEHNQIEDAQTGILIGDSKGVDWTGKFDTKRYPSRTIQDVPPSENQISDNRMVRTANEIVRNDQ
ncbi:hypothetical protein MUY27_05490 [Mucilaginibacter sp. RS28]|uniref:Chondroitinase B n=1 Tax=Mucilaginibacter straminoryzae TaxID=2932774 RepID=A0A9X1X202_9SPHI|nr:chondroitinase-B domain-containing protein [Mucilaginibacter straminoryzae]MCJ8209151.1 hypothetical protein [Mucilaginibacter straminoryzae]